MLTTAQGKQVLQGSQASKLAIQVKIKIVDILHSDYFVCNKSLHDITSRVAL